MGGMAVSAASLNGGISLACILDSKRCNVEARWKVDAALGWRSGARNASSFRGRRHSRAAARCGSAGSVGESGMRSAAAVLDVYLFRELLPPLVLGTAAFTVLGVSIGTRR